MSYEPIENDFEVKFCEMCRGEMIVCPKCGNNCCNASFGKMDKDGNPVKWDSKGKYIEGCDVCHLTYQYQDLYWRLQEFCVCDNQCKCLNPENDKTGLWTGKFELNNECPLHGKVKAGVNPECPVHGKVKQHE